MAKLSNSPKQALNFDLERRKSFTFRVRLRFTNGTRVDLTGCTLRFVMKQLGMDDDHFDLNNLIVNSTATVGDPVSGDAVFAFQAAELDGDPGEYGYSIVLWSPDNFSTVLAKGVVNLVDNSEAHSMHRFYSETNPASALELTLRGGDVVELNVPALATIADPDQIYAAVERYVLQHPIPSGPSAPAASVSAVDNGDGTATLTFSNQTMFTDNGDGTATLNF